MTVTDIRKDSQSRTITLEAEFDASPERVWQLWADPRQLERWWGPPPYPATVDAHDLRHGGRVEYHMIGPKGDQPRGYWDVDVVQPPYRLVFRDGFANEDGTPNTELPMTTMRVNIEEIGGGKTRMSIVSEFPTVEAIERPRRLLLVTTETRLDGSRLAFSTEFTFAPRDGATLMTMVQWGFPSDELRDEHGRGLPHAFDRLERAL